MTSILTEKDLTELCVMLGRHDHTSNKAGTVIYNSLSNEDKLKLLLFMKNQEWFTYRNHLFALLIKDNLIKTIWKDLELIEEKEFKKIFNASSIKFILSKVDIGFKGENFLAMYNFCSKYMTNKAIKKFITSKLFYIFFSYGDSSNYQNSTTVNALLPEVKKLKIDMKEEFLYLCKHWQGNDQEEIMRFLLSKKKTDEFKKLFKIPKSVDLTKIWLTCLSEDGSESISRYEDLMVKASYSMTPEDLDINIKKLIEVSIKRSNLRLIYSFADSDKIFTKILKNFPDNLFFKFAKDYSNYGYNLTDIMKRCSRDSYSMIFKKYLKGEKLCK